MKYFSRIGFKDREGRVWFSADRYLTSGDAFLEFEYPTMVSASAVNIDTAGDLQASLPYLVAQLAGESDSLPLSGDLTAEMTVPDMVGTAICNLLVAEILPLTASCGTGARVDCDFTEWVFRAGQGYMIEADARPFACEFYSDYRSDDMNNCTFRELTLEAFGQNSYTFMSASLMRPDMEMSVGNAIEMAFEVPLALGQGSNGLVAGMVCWARPMELAVALRERLLLSGELVVPEMVASATTSVRARIVATMQSPLAQGEGNNTVVARVDGRLGMLRLQMSGEIHPTGTVGARLLPLQGEMNVFSEVMGISLSAELDRLTILASLHLDGPNHINITFPPIGGGSVAGDGAVGFCTSTGVLKYEEVLL